MLALPTVFAVTMCMPVCVFACLSECVHERVRVCVLFMCAETPEEPPAPAEPEAPTTDASGEVVAPVPAVGPGGFAPMPVHLQNQLGVRPVPM